MLTSGDITKQLRRSFPSLESGNIRYAIRRLGLEPMQVAGHIYLYKDSAIDEVRRFLQTKAVRRQKSAMSQ